MTAKVVGSGALLGGMARKRASRASQDEVDSNNEPTATEILELPVGFDCVTWTEGSNTHHPLRVFEQPRVSTAWNPLNSARPTACALKILISKRRMLNRSGYGPTSKMSHDRGWRAACRMTIWILGFHFGIREVARGVTAMVVGSGALLGGMVRKRASRAS